MPSVRHRTGILDNLMCDSPSERLFCVLLLTSCLIVLVGYPAENSKDNLNKSREFPGIFSLQLRSAEEILYSIEDNFIIIDIYYYIRN